ncbi:hypothetical protein N4W15_004000 [Salmonella enterica]|uniref:hypothetical protein n=1 Tax=Enterobacter hormaechei TaxID=158836 RepID=UPI002F167BC5|nr:hypothetical protein [Salmonella enterica]EJX2344423.1 hypothetical protein [Salmonella enterica]
MSRPLTGLNPLYVKILLAMQEGKTPKEAALDAGYPANADYKKPTQRARKKLQAASLKEEIRRAIREGHPSLVLMGSGKETVLKPNTEVYRQFAEIDEGFRLFFEAHPEFLPATYKVKK